MEHRRVEPERRARVDDREQRRLAVERLLVDAARDARHLDRVGDALATQRIRVDRLVGEGQQVPQRVQMPDRGVDVDRLDRVAGEEVDRVEHLAKPDQVLVVGPVADPPAVVEVRDVGRRGDRPERRPVAADLEVVLRVRGVQRERRGRRPDPLDDHVPVEANALAAVLDSRAGRAQEVPGAVVEEVHPDLLEDAQGGEMDRFELVRRHDLGRRVADPWLGPRPLLGQPASLARRTVAAGPSSARRLAGAGLDAGHVVDHRRSGSAAGSTQAPTTRRGACRARAAPARR